MSDLVLLEPTPENFFQSCFSDCIRMIVGYLTIANGKTGRKKTHRWPDCIIFMENFMLTLIFYPACCHKDYNGFSSRSSTEQSQK